MFRFFRPASPPLEDTTTTNADAATCRQQTLTRSSRTLTHHHPNVKLPPRIEEKPKEEQIRRCCDRFKSHPSTVDTLIRSLTTILCHPLEGRYRRINQNNSGYQRSLAMVPGAEQFLLALGFRQVNSQTLFLATIDRKLLNMALAILEETRQTPEYQQAKEEQIFATEVTKLLQARPTREEALKRLDLLSQIPKVSSQERSAVMMIQLGDNDATTLNRRFEGDDTLQDVLHWLGGTVGTILLDSLCSSRQWSLVDVNRQGQVPINCQTNRHKTLQHLGFWPSGRLALRPSSPEWLQEAFLKVELGASRGLGSAPSDTLHF